MTIFMDLSYLMNLPTKETGKEQASGSYNGWKIKTIPSAQECGISIQITNVYDVNYYLSNDAQ